MQLSFDELCKVLDPGICDPTVWHKIIDRRTRTAFFFQVDYGAKVPRLSRSVRVRPEVSYGYLETLKPTVFLGASEVEADFVDSILGRDYINDWDEVTRLLEGVALADLPDNEHSDVSPEDGARVNPAIAKLNALFGAPSTIEPPTNSSQQKRKRSRNTPRETSARDEKPLSFLSAQDFSTMSSAESGLPDAFSHDLNFLQPQTEDGSQSRSCAVDEKYLTVNAEAFVFTLPPADNASSKESTSVATKDNSDEDYEGHESGDETSGSESSWKDWEKRSRSKKGPGTSRRTEPTSAKKTKKLEVPLVPFTFLKNPKTDDVKGYIKLEPDSKIWVRVDRVERVMNEAESVKEYARKLMWEVIMDEANIIQAIESKIPKIGFVKLLGSRNLTSVYEHILAVRRQKLSTKAGGKWEKQTPSQIVLKDSWRKYFPYAMQMAQAAKKREAEIPTRK